MGLMNDRMLRGELYIADDPDIHAGLARGAELVQAYNSIPFSDGEERERALRRLLGEVGDNVIIRPTFHCDYGENISIGADTYVNFDCVMLDPAPIRIGAKCAIASKVQLLTATHPIDPAARLAGWEYAKPITIGDNVWLGGGAVVCPGVSIGDHTVVGAGAVVTEDLPGGVVAVGVPARVQRRIGERDAVEIPEISP